MSDRDSFTNLTPAQLRDQVRAGNRPMLYDYYGDHDLVTRVVEPTGMLGFGQYKWTIYFEENGSPRSRAVDTKETVKITLKS